MRCNFCMLDTVIDKSLPQAFERLIDGLSTSPLLMRARDFEGFKARDRYDMVEKCGTVL